MEDSLFEARSEAPAYAEDAKNIGAPLPMQETAQRPGKTEGKHSEAPSQHFGLFYRTGFLLTSMVAGISSVSIKQLLLPIQVGLLDPRNTNTSFAIVSALGALAGLLAAPVTGALADRTISRWGRRRPWIVAGILIGCAGLLTMAWSTTIPLLLIGEMLEQVGVDAVLANVTALIPDQIPESRRANTAALNGMAPIVGGVVGLVLVTALTNTRIISQGYLLLAVVALLCVGLFLLVLREPALPGATAPAFHLRSFLASFASPLRSRDFTLTLFSRLLIFLCYTLLGSYLLFYIHGKLHAPLGVAAREVTTYQLISRGMLTVVALLTGSLSQRMNRLKPFVIVGSLLMTSGVFVIVFSPTWSALFLAAAIFGAGFGMYLGVDIALAVKVLPSDLSRGKDLGIMYTAIFFPLIVTPILGASILNNFANNFALLFSIAAMASLLAAGLLVPIRSVK